MVGTVTVKARRFAGRLRFLWVASWLLILLANALAAIDSLASISARPDWIITNAATLVLYGGGAVLIVRRHATTKDGSAAIGLASLVGAGIIASTETVLSAALGLSRMTVAVAQIGLALAASVVVSGCWMLLRHGRWAEARNTP